MLTEMVQLFRRLKITAINVTHDQDEAMSMSDRIMVLRDGVVQQIGTPTDLYRHPVNPFVASFMGYANMLVGEIIEQVDDTQMLSLRLGEEPETSRVVTGQLHENVRSRLQGRARLLFRPEDIQVHQEARSVAHLNVFAGRVSHSSFVGGQWRTLITLDTVQPVQVLAFPTFQPCIEQRLWLELPPERCQIVPE
jgi:ABC-type Fe3+/spermidine/putrescine transport system ATPase subunit